VHPLLSPGSAWLGLLLSVSASFGSAAVLRATTQRAEAPTPSSASDEQVRDALVFARLLQEALTRDELTLRTLEERLRPQVLQVEVPWGGAHGLFTIWLEVRTGLVRCWLKASALEGLDDWYLLEAHARLWLEGPEDGSQAVAIRHLEEEIRKAWNVPFEELDDGFELSWRSRILVQPERADPIQETHAILQMPAGPEQQLAAQALLSSPFHEYRFHHETRKTRLPHPLQLVPLLVEAERWDLLREVLHGLNSAGRVYAARALLTSGRLEPEDEEAIAALRRTATLVEYRSGCTVLLYTAGALVDMHELVNVVVEMEWRARAHQELEKPLQERIDEKVRRVTGRPNRRESGASSPAPLRRAQ
jgi:hypothetical protein